MAQIAENRLFDRVLPSCNAGSARLQRPAGKYSGITGNLNDRIYPVLDCGIAFVSRRQFPVELGRMRL